MSIVNMKIQIEIFFFIFAFSNQIFAENDPKEGSQCFVDGECRYSNLIDTSTTRDEHECLKACKANVNCKWFSHSAKYQYCQIFTDCSVLEGTLCPDCKSGQKDCWSPEPECGLIGECRGNISYFEGNVQNKDICLEHCQRDPECKWFTHDSSTSICSVMLDCDTLDESCLDCSSGEYSCQTSESENAWHLILSQSTVELFNWKSGEQCQYPDLKNITREPSGTIFNDIPVYCGGGAIDCFKFNKNSKAWEPISSLFYGIAWAGSAMVPSHGWFIFGGYANPLNTSQKLSALDETWEMGPDVYESKPNVGVCVVQINETVTVFLGGVNNPHGIVTFDWTTLEYTKHKPELKGDRTYSSCALFLDEKGAPLVAVAGGQSNPEGRGMEIWNPLNGSVSTQTDLLPSEEGGTFGLQDAQLVPINGGSELLLYGGWANVSVNGNENDGIWKYSMVENSWTKFGTMLFRRQELIVLPVTGMHC